jgi:integrase
MALEMKATSRWWYGRFLVNGKLRRFPLVEMRDGREQRIEVKGRRPASMKHPETGDAAFLESYHRARAAHDRLAGDTLAKKSVEDLAQRIIEAKTGTRLDFVRVDALAELWAKTRGTGELHPTYKGTMMARLRAFSQFMAEHYPKVEELCAVSADQVRGFLEAETKRGVAGRTWNIVFGLLKAVFKDHAPTADAFKNLLNKRRQTKTEHTVHRQPFREEEMDALLRASQADEVLYGPVVTAACTAMRRGDCCLLKWASVDLKAGFIEVPTSKTGEVAEIPILPLLREALASAPKSGSEFVWPAAAELYQNDQSALDRRFRVVLRTAGFVNARTARAVERGANGAGEAKAPLPERPPEETRRRGLKAIAKGDMIEAKRVRMKAVFLAYVGGQGLPTVARELGLSKSTVSLQLHEVEDMLGAAVLRRPPPPVPLPAVIRGNTQSERGAGGTQRRSVRGWHSFRVGFVTRALAAGMPEELVRRVTGHTAVDVVREHYFKPGREEFKREFEKAMPKLLMNGAKSREEQMREIIEQVTPRTWKRDKAQLLALLNPPS